MNYILIEMIDLQILVKCTINYVRKTDHQTM